MGVLEVLSRKTGVIVGDDVLALFKYAREHEFAIPAINVTSSSTVIAALEAARDAKSPVILQVSQGGAAFFAGKGVSNTDQKASVAGAIAAAHFIRSIAPLYTVCVLHTDHCAKKLLPWFDGMLEADEKYFKEHGEPLFSSHMIDLSEEAVDFNIQTTAAYLKRAAPMKQWLEMEIGITGGEEDGVNNEDVDNNSLYTQPEDILAIVNALAPISPYFSIAAGFGNVHGKVLFDFVCRFFFFLASITDIPRAQACTSLAMSSFTPNCSASIRSTLRSSCPRPRTSLSSSSSMAALAPVRMSTCRLSSWAW